MFAISMNMTSTVQKLLPEKMTVTEKTLGMSLFLAQLFPEDGAENGRKWQIL